MSLRSATVFALVGMVVLTVLLLVRFIRYLSSYMHGALSDVELLAALIYLFASLSLAVFLYVFHRSQS